MMRKIQERHERLLRFPARAMALQERMNRMSVKGTPHQTLESQIDRPLAAKLTGNMIQEFKTHRYQRGL
jgi:hypothetical protein